MFVLGKQEYQIVYNTFSIPKSISNLDIKFNIKCSILCRVNVDTTRIPNKNLDLISIGKYYQQFDTK